jgi:thiamine biosynthesis lipoprotein
VSSTFPALGTTVVVVTVDGRRERAARAAVERELDAIDRACSRFRSDSELARVNRGAGKPVEIGPLLLEALEVALEAARRSGGLVDPTVGRALRIAGYDATFRVVAARDGDTFTPRFSRAPGWESITLDRTASTVRIPAGVELDLGATAKALACDRAAAAADAVAGPTLVSIGGDVAVAGAAPDGGWPVRVTDDHAAPPDAPGQTVAISTGGLATSSTTVRRWRSGTTELHHLLDPRTGRPAASPWRTVSVAATTCVDANVASTAAFLVDDARAWLETRSLPARLVSVAGASSAVGGWPEDEA